MRQFDHARLRRQHVEMRIDGKRGGFARAKLRTDVALPSKQLANPGNALQILRVWACVGRPYQSRRFLFVPPMGGHTVLCMIMHFLSTNLDFEGALVIAQNDGMKRPVAVGFRTRNVIIEVVSEGAPERMHDPKHGVASAHIPHDDAKRAQVLHLVKIKPFRAHLRSDAVDVFGAPRDLACNPSLGELLAQSRDRSGNAGLALGTSFVQAARDGSVLIGVKKPKGEVFEFPLQLPQTKAIRQRCQHLEGVLGEAGLGFALHCRVKAQGL